MSTDKEDFQVGDYILPKVVGLMELGDPPYKIEKIDDKVYTVVQTMGSHRHVLELTKGRLRKI